MDIKKSKPIQLEKELVIVYNADSDLLNRMIGFSHKIISPQTYPCKICQLTWGPVFMQKEWAEFIKEIPFKVVFEYKDQWKDNHRLPLVILKEEGNQRVLLSAEQINEMDSLPELIRCLKRKLGL